MTLRDLIPADPPDQLLSLALLLLLILAMVWVRLLALKIQRLQERSRKQRQLINYLKTARWQLSAVYKDRRPKNL